MGLIKKSAVLSLVLLLGSACGGGKLNYMPCFHGRALASGYISPEHVAAESSHPPLLARFSFLGVTGTNYVLLNPRPILYSGGKSHMSGAVSDTVSCCLQFVLNCGQWIDLFK